jgi:hypothetical protein
VLPKLKPVSIATKRLLAALDIAGLVLLTVTTILDVLDLEDYCGNKHFAKPFAARVIVSGVSLQIIGLVVLIYFSFNLQEHPNHEQIGMFLLTLGPLLNLFGKASFKAVGDETFKLLVKSEAAFEIFEIVGMGVLDLSMIRAKGHEFLLLLVELFGLLLLSIKSLTEFEYQAVKQQVPAFQLKFDFMRGSEAMGYLLFVAKALYQYNLG